MKNDRYGSVQSLVIAIALCTAAGFGDPAVRTALAADGDKSIHQPFRRAAVTAPSLPFEQFAKEHIAVQNELRGLGQYMIEESPINLSAARINNSAAILRRTPHLEEPLKSHTGSLIQEITPPVYGNGYSELNGLKKVTAGSDAFSRRKQLKTSRLERELVSHLKMAIDTDLSGLLTEPPAIDAVISSEAEVVETPQLQTVPEEVVSDAVIEWEEERREKDSFLIKQMKADTEMGRLRALLDDLEQRWGRG